MCGLCGFVGHVEADYLDEMSGTLVHRGPDSGGSYVGKRVGFGVRRLSIVDIQRGGQPVTNEDSSVVVAFNGEIYNSAQLRDRLMATGHRFASHSDTEVIPHAYEEYGDAAI